MNQRQQLALTLILDHALGRPPEALTVTRRHRPTGLTVMSLLAVDR
jgi:hypothetical protein